MLFWPRGGPSFGWQLRGERRFARLKGEETKNQDPPSARGFSGFGPQGQKWGKVAACLGFKGGRCREDDSLGFLPFGWLPGKEEGPETVGLCPLL